MIALPFPCVVGGPYSGALVPGSPPGWLLVLSVAGVPATPEALIRPGRLFLLVLADGGRIDRAGERRIGAVLGEGGAAGIVLPDVFQAIRLRDRLRAGKTS